MQEPLGRPGQRSEVTDEGCTAALWCHVGAKTVKLQATWDIAFRVARENRLIGKEKPILLEQLLWADPSCMKKRTVAELESFAY